RVRPPPGQAARTRSVDGGCHAEGGGVLAGPARQIEVAAGDPADVVARQRHGDLGIRQREVRVMVRLLGGGTDAVDELETGREVAGGEADGEGLTVLAPAGGDGVDDLGGGEGLLRLSHAPIVPLSRADGYPSPGCGDRSRAPRRIARRSTTWAMSST